jgi:N4-gp56 family major capsid protein
MTVIKSGSTAANKLFNTALFVQATRGNNFTNLLTDVAPKSVDTKKIDPSKQTPSGAPIVRVTDLSKTKGDEVTMDLFHELRARPTMGDKKLAGRSESLTTSQFTAKINQGRHIVDSGGKMTQQRTMQDLVRVANAMLSPYYMKLADQITHVHLAGARGSDVSSDWLLPLSTDSEFQDIVVNSVTPPTFDRHFYANDATAISNIDSSDKLTLADIDRLRLALDEMANPIQPIKFSGDPMSEENPFYVLYVTPRQWFDFSQSTDAATLRTLQANSIARGSYFKSPIFTGESFLWNNILIKKARRPVTFAAGSSVSVCTNTANAATTNVTATVAVDRAILLGAQALADMYGMSGNANEGGYHFSTHTEKTDHENALEHSISWMNGKAKIRFEGANGFISDHGVMVLDTARS